MVKVITYGTYDMLHYGHIRLLERAKSLGDYLIVGVTSENYDNIRGKINNQQSLAERIEGIRATGLADEIIVEEYEGQKIDDIVRLGIDIFTVGDDWEGYFDYLREYCQVFYLKRTEGISSSEIRSKKREIRFGIAGVGILPEKVAGECKFVNGMELRSIYANNLAFLPDAFLKLETVTDNYGIFLDSVDAVYIKSDPKRHYNLIKNALNKGVHVLCESPICLTKSGYDEVVELARQKGCILMQGIKTAYSTAYNRLLLLIKTGVIGDVVSIECTCTSLEFTGFQGNLGKVWEGPYEWGPTALLPVLQILGNDYSRHETYVKISDGRTNRIGFISSIFLYEHAIASIKIGDSVKSEGDMVISGTKGYIYVPSPWWKTDYFEIRFEEPQRNKRYFYQLEGEGIRFELVSFVKAIQMKSHSHSKVSVASGRSISGYMDDILNGCNVTYI